MAFKVKLFSGMPDYEALHVAKLTCFPLEKRDYKPYSQARVCFAADGMHLQLLAFEAKPLPDSAITGVFDLGADGFPLTVVTVYADGRLETDTPDVTVHTFTGEDLQGMYWGANVVIPTDAIRIPIEAETVFQGNLYKLCRDPQKPHFGCFYPANFDQPLTAPENLGAFAVIDY